MNKSKVGIGIVGIGNIGSAHVRFVKELDNCYLAGLCDINPAAFERAPQEIRSAVPLYSNASELLENPDVDLVIVSVPHYSHPDIAIAAMEHGKHVIVEKPIAADKKNALRLLEVAARHPELKKSAMFNQRTVAIHLKLKELIDKGELGKIQRINWTITHWFRSQMYYDSGDWRATWKGEGGGALLNQCPHQLDLFQWFFGMPQKVTSIVRLGKYHDIEVEDEVNAILEYENGMIANFITSTGEAPGENRLEIVGDKGRLIMEDMKLTFTRNEIPTSIWLKTCQEKFTPPPVWDCNVRYTPETMQEHQRIIENVSNAILGKEQLIAPLEEGIKSLELGNAMLLSGLKHKTVELPLDADEYSALLAELIANSKDKQKKCVQNAVNEDFSRSF